MSYTRCLARMREIDTCTYEHQGFRISYDGETGLWDRRPTPTAIFGQHALECLKSDDLYLSRTLRHSIRQPTKNIVDDGDQRELKNFLKNGAATIIQCSRGSSSKTVDARRASRDFLELKPRN